jgi:hypothetical protein
VTILGVSACTNSWDKDLYDEDAVNKLQAQKIFGSIDSKQDWNSICEGKITVTADAALDDIVKVQILTESPFFNTNARVLNEAAVKKGGKVTLTYDAPNIYDQLVAACVSSKGVYYIQVFTPGDATVSFSHSAKARTTRATGSEAPTFTSIKLSAPHKSFNAMRAEKGDACTINGKSYTEWADGSWANELMWQLSDDNTFDNGWKMDTQKNMGVIYRDIDGFAEGELDNIKAITDVFLFKTSNDRYSVSGKKNNIRLIRESANFTLNNNYLITNGVTPVTLIPIQAYTTEFKKNHIYYYYYKPEDIPADMDEVAYIKQLPKFKAIQVERVCTTPQSTAGEFFRNKEFLLPFYGESPVQGANSAQAIFPKGYKIGFLNMKHTNNDYNVSNCMFGCTYGDGRLNYEVNHISGHYLSAMDKSIGGSTEEGMQFNDPRIAVFSANGKTYMCFEEGADCNFCDMVIEVGGGTEIVEEPQDPESLTYTMCFEDELNKADYDMNDLVLQAIRINPERIQLSIVACGGVDDLYIKGLEEGCYLASKEIHVFFYGKKKTTNNFVNTMKGQQWLNPVSETLDIDPSMSTSEFLKGISVLNATTGKTIAVPKTTGEPPYAIIVPLNFRYPLEGLNITTVYKEFVKWAKDINVSNNWYQLLDAEKAYPDMFTKNQ